MDFILIIYHYPLCGDGIMKCYIMYNRNVPAAVASVINNNGIASLEFVATISQMRRQGFAKAVCEKAGHLIFSFLVTAPP